MSSRYVEAGVVVNRSYTVTISSISDYDSLGVGLYVRSSGLPLGDGLLH